ncbi:SoxR reducing system RseC family protein [Pseudoalteromonas sp. McH1-7]|uniref:Sigma-E factor negative regulatory protein RseC n=1 Tax=Pseudoalteromonas peptidolytica F12-50-A1 TaxID=1315280 RepID=A0A8I0T3E2_9GAMM|nr:MULTISPECIES: SoxR reducing system RseC family protein [Pseudoalteromonas]MBE0345855.1 sigma-E factor negative regulatory protein RseC [Pseudoalteromonas peptidolytica F12-50-A1]MDW7547936.1 SoxR reducing system RseC family protein [Pseudoalteromonas peptidolytica]NLR16060.1 SoxR reducing system RseC family protein [Pseudoalteromonas peptidolytica]NUZ11072.1 SoxR reducing system RseC family protein [Pseudoalteromonas sp. McH1-7]RRS06522.1 regulator [Pseudoalteromonas sp. J010]
MIEQTLTVAAIKGATVYLEAEPKPACEGCNGKCGSQVFAKLFGTHKKQFPIELPESSVAVGQKIKLALDDSNVVRHAFYVYMLPLFFAFIAMFFTALVLNLSEPLQIVSAFLSASVGFFLAKMKGDSLKHQVKVIKIYPISLAITQIDGDCTK